MTRPAIDTSNVLAVAATTAVVALVLAAAAPAVFVILFATLPLWVHVRLSGGVRKAVRPTPATVVLAFYPFFFPVAALGVTTPTDEYGSILERVPTTAEIRPVLIGVTVAMTAFVIAFHRASGRQNSEPAPVVPTDHGRARAVILAALLGTLAVVGLAIVVRENGSIAAVTSRYATHSKTVAVGGTDRIGITLWSSFSILAGWAAMVVVADRRAQRGLRVVFGLLIVGVLAAQTLIFASRLYPILTLIGVWVMWINLGHRIRPGVFAVVAVLALLGSAQLLEWRTLGRAGSATDYRDYTRIAGYSVLETITAVRQRPTNVHDQLAEPQRWRDGPLYILPRAFRPVIPDLERRRLDGYIANALGDPNQRRTTGFPASFVTELWLLGGWSLAIAGGAIFGALVGTGHRLLLRHATRQPVGALMLYANLCAFGFTYFKDGDVLVSTVNGIKGTFYLVVVIGLTGLLTAERSARRSRAVANPQPVGGRA